MRDAGGNLTSLSLNLFYIWIFFKKRLLKGQELNYMRKGP